MQLCYQASPRLSWFLRTHARGTAIGARPLHRAWGNRVHNNFSPIRWDTISGSILQARHTQVPGAQAGVGNRRTYQIPFNALPLRWETISCDILQAGAHLRARARPNRLQGPTSLRPCAGACCSHTMTWHSYRLSKRRTLQHAKRARALWQRMGTLTAPCPLAFVASFPLSFSLSFSMACKIRSWKHRGGNWT